MSKKNKLSIFEIVWYLLTGAVGLWGLTYVVLGIVAAYYPETSSNNPLGKANEVIAKNFGLGFLYWGIIILAIAVVSAVFVLCIYAKTADREAEKASRRAARLAAAKVVDVEPETKVAE